jgi:ribose transport system permease protein
MFGISNIVLISCLMALVLGILLTRLKIFKQIYLVGTSKNAAFMSGIPSNRIIEAGYSISGFFAGLTGVVLTSRYAMGFAGFFVGSEMRAIAAAVIGGAVMGGGEGNMFGTVMGVLLVALVNNAFIMFNGSAEWQNAISGIMLIIALFIDVLRTRRAKNRGLL